MDKLRTGKGLSKKRKNIIGGNFNVVEHDRYDDDSGDQKDHDDDDDEEEEHDDDEDNVEEKKGK